MVNFDVALSALRSGDRIMVTLKDPTKESDRTRYNLLGGGRSFSGDLSQAIGSAGAGRGWAVSGGCAFADLSVGG